MLGSLFRMSGMLVGILLLLTPAWAQSPPPVSLATARELVSTLDLPSQFRAVMPMVMKNLKPVIVQGRSNLDRDFDALMPILLDAFQTRIGEISEAAALIYANNFSAEELRAIIAFYRTPAGQKFLQKQPVVAQQTMAAGQQFGQSIAADMQKRMMEELRKKGHTL